MARMHSRARGKSGSKKPVEKGKITWLRYSNEEINQLIIKIAKTGKTPSQIGLVLRDVYGVPDVKRVLNKKMNKILEENKLLGDLPEDLVALIRKDIKIMEHMEENKKDMFAKRGLNLTESKINRLVKYYKKSGRLDKTWKYNRNNAKLLVG
ncbi:30S ribosomal protein S15 [archaeon]|nr:30S ribosomal protein S15 [archaeon]|tara:strand:- start:7328 stop:7783 length:456 start_codon:yes stop_codon:yes gene_type:complete